MGTILLELSAQASGPVLELGCGTGRVAIPLAQQGINITGLDILPHMIAHARKKAQDLPIEWVCADVRNFCLDNRYTLIFTYGAVFQHLLQRGDQEAFFARVHEHLASGGLFVIDLGFKHPQAMVNVPEEKEWYTFVDEQGNEVKVTGTDHYDHIQQIWVQTAYQRLMGADQTQDPRPVTLSLRYFMPQEIEALLHYNGFQVLSRYGDWAGNPLKEDSYMQIYVCTTQQ